MATECHVILTDVPSDREFPVAKLLAHLLELTLQEARNLVKSTPIAVLERVSSQEAKTYQQELERAGATVNIKEVQIGASFQVDDKSSLDKYYSELASIHDNFQKMIALQGELERISQQVIPPQLNQSLIDKLRQDLSNVRDQLRSTEMEVKNLRTARLIHIFILIGVGVVTALISHNLVVTTGFMAIAILIQATFNKIEYK